MSTRVVKLTVINDIVCSFCYIGHRELVDAVIAAKKLRLPLDFDIEYLPFRLISAACLCENKSVDKKTFYGKKYGEERLNKMMEVVQKWIDEKKSNLKFGGVVSQTTRAHRLSRKAYKMGGMRYQLPLLNALFKTYGDENKDIGDIDVLVELAASVDMMTREEARAFLESDELKDEVIKIAEDLRSKGIQGVPVTVIDGKWIVSGGQPADVYLQIFKKLAAAPAHSAPSPPSFPTSVVESLAA